MFSQLPCLTCNGFSAAKPDAGLQPARRFRRAKLLRASDGNSQRGPVFRVDVMRREPGFGEAYGKNRTGEWEYVSYQVDRSFWTPPAQTASSAAYHLNKAPVKRTTSCFPS
jgi:hypothetical protein